MFLTYKIIFLPASPWTEWMSDSSSMHADSSPFLIYIKGFAIDFLHVEGARLSACTPIQMHRAFGMTLESIESWSQADCWELLLLSWRNF